MGYAGCREKPQLQDPRRFCILVSGCQRGDVLEIAVVVHGSIGEVCVVWGCVKRPGK